MNKTFKRVLTAVFVYALFDALILGYAGFIPGVSMAAAQTSLTQTTLSAAQGIGPASAAGGAQANLSTVISLASATGVQTAFLGVQPVTFAYVDQELEGIQTLVNGQTTIFNVLRAQGGTKSAYHASGAMVLIGTVSPQFGGFSGSGGFQQTDPPLGGVCNLANTGYTPWVNVITGAQWQCTSTNGTPANNGVWTPSWNNPLAKQSPYTTAAVASVAGATLPSGPFFHLTGTNAITSWTIPVGFNATAVGSGSFCFIADGASSTTATNNIGTAITFTANNVYCFFWDQQNSKFYVK